MTIWMRLLRSRRAERELDAELRDHLERQVADFKSAGFSDAEARRRARLEFGGLDQTKELCRDARGTRLIEEIVQDAGYALRLFVKAPGFSAAAVLTLALGIGANMAVFSLIEALLLRPLPVSRPDELVQLLRVQGSQSGGSFSYPQVEELARQSELVSSLCAFGHDTLNVGPLDAIEPVRAAWVTGNYYQTQELQVVGVVRDAVYESLREVPPPTMYVPFNQRDARMSLILYAPGTITEVASSIRRDIQPKLGGKPLRIRTLTSQLETSLVRERLMATVAGTFGALALILAAVGLYGLLAYWVNRRTHEIGIRMALGAVRAQVLGLILGDAVRMLALGTLVGIPAAWALARSMSSLLWGLEASDMPTFVSAAAILAATGLVAAWIPARRATRVNPVLALRAE